ncbi:hypothetical protein OQA88_3288 [Cercophora sp. LCS_1]
MESTNNFLFRGSQNPTPFTSAIFAIVVDQASSDSTVTADLASSAIDVILHVAEQIPHDLDDDRAEDDEACGHDLLLDLIDELVQYSLTSTTRSGPDVPATQLFGSVSVICRAVEDAWREPRDQDDDWRHSEWVNLQAFCARLFDCGLLPPRM